MGCGCQEAITQYDRSCQQSWGFVLEFIHFEQVSFFKQTLKRKKCTMFIRNTCNYLLRLMFINSTTDDTIIKVSKKSFLFLSGSRSGAIHHHDVRVAEHQVGTLLGHTQEVCGLKWSPDGKFLASGGNDNLLNIWNAQPGSPLTNTTPLHTFSQHQAAVKVICSSL